MSVRYRIELEGFPAETFAEGESFASSETDADGDPVTVQRVIDSPERAWDAYKAKHGPQVRRRNHNRTPVVTRLEE